MFRRETILFLYLCVLFTVVSCVEQKRRSHIVTPQRVDSAGAPLTPGVHPHYMRPRRKFNSKVYYKINLDGKEYQLDLRLNKQLHADQSSLESFMPDCNNNTITNVKVCKYLDKHCHFIGVVKGQSHSKVALTNCNGLMGYIFLNDALYLIEPLNLNDTATSDSGHPHVLYSRGGRGAGRRSGGCGVRGNKDEVREGKRRVREHKKVPSFKPEKPLFEHQGYIKRMYMEITLVLDKTLIDFHASRDLEAYMLTVMNIAHAAMADTTFGAPLELVLVRMIRLEHEDDEMNMAITPDCEKVLEVFEAWQMRMNPTYDTHPDHHDMAILVTRVDICMVNHPENCGLLGLTQLGMVCDPQASAMVVEDNGLELGFSIAHELGHALGMHHDSEEESGCDPSPYGDGYDVVMADGVSLWMRGWSNCSREYLWAWLDTGQSYCLYDSPQSDRYQLGAVLPGAAFGAHHQCRLYFGQDSTQCPDEGIECRNRKCMVAGDGCVQTHEPLADGTPCAAHHWCYRGQCVNEGMRPSSHDGGWSEWGPWTPCSRSCGAGVTRSVRYCDQPPPSDGGLYCTGQRMRFDICNPQGCPQGEPTFRDVQCKEFNNMPYWETNATHTWKGVATLAENPCELVCENEEKVRAALKAQVEDGTPCYLGEHHICVAGACREVACDMALNSKAVEDACGVCHGDGNSCTAETKELTFHPKTHYQVVVVVPQHTLFVTAEEMFPTASDFIVLSGSETLVTGRKFGVTIVGTMRLWMGQLRHQQEMVKIRGPVTRELKVMIAARDEVSVRYTLGAPGGNQSPTYVWQYVDWGECSEPCGPGIQVQEAKCVGNITGIVEDKYCVIIDKPAIMQRECEMRACAPRWQIGEWSGCECVCAEPVEEREEEERAVDCVRRVGNHEESVVDDRHCEPPKPAELRDCVCPEDNATTTAANATTATAAPANSVTRVDVSYHQTLGHHKRADDTTSKLSHILVPETLRNARKHHHNKHDKHVHVASDSVLCHSHIQNVHAISELRGSLIVDYQNLDSLDLALELDPLDVGEGRHGRPPGFPQPRSKDNLVHIKGDEAVRFLLKVQKRSHNNYSFSIGAH